MIHIFSRLNKDDITSEERNQTKTLIYALMYGAGVKKVAAILSMSVNEAERIKNSFLSKNKILIMITYFAWDLKNP